MEHYTQLGVGGVFVIVVLEKVFTFLKGFKNKKGDCEECQRILMELFKMHNVKDEDGVPVWYLRRSLESAIEKLVVSISAQTDVFKELVIRIQSKEK